MAFIPHKYYVSTSLYEFKEDKGSLQITIKIFKDDFINAIKTNNGIDLYMRDDLNSEELVSINPKTFLDISITLNCIPKQIPKKGTLFSLANFIA